MPKCARQAAGAIPPAGVSEVLAPHPLEISGVAAVSGGYAVVGDEDNEHGRIWPGGARFDFAGKLKGPELIDVGIGAGGESLWLVLGERKGRLIDLDGGACEFADPLRMRHGRGLEGVAVRWRDGRWQVALAWEGGFYDWDSPARGTYAKPRIALLTWTRGEGMRGGPDITFELEVPEPSVGQRFRAPDLVFDRDGLLCCSPRPMPDASGASTPGCSASTWRVGRRGSPCGSRRPGAVITMTKTGRAWTGRLTEPPWCWPMTRRTRSATAPWPSRRTPSAGPGALPRGGG